MTNWKQRCGAFLLAFMLVLALPVSAEAASRGVYYRPAITFVVNNAPDDMILRMDFDCDGETVPVYLYMETRLWETYYRFYRQTALGVRSWNGNRADFQDSVLVVETGGREIEITLPEDVLRQMSMNDFFMLDATDYTLSFGLPLGRAVLLFFLRLAITLAGALLVLLLFQYRWLKSWLSVIVTNLICQGGISLFLANRINFNPKLLAVLFVVVLAVLIVQIPIFWWLLDEEESSKRVSYAVVSNVVTGALNFMILLNIPL